MDQPFSEPSTYLAAMISGLASVLSVRNHAETVKGYGLIPAVSGKAATALVPLNRKAVPAPANRFIPAIKIAHTVKILVRNLIIFRIPLLVAVFKLKSR